MKLVKVVISFLLSGVMPLGSASAAQSPQSNEIQSNTYKADNSGKNKRDLNANELTAQDQSNSKADVELTRTIRQALVGEKDLSTFAHNVKIIVSQNSVTLKGPVQSKHELDVVLAKARSAAPNRAIYNELEITR